MISFLQRVFLCAVIFMSGMSASGQRLALKTNTLDWLIQSPNLTMEARLNRRLTIDLGIACNPIKKTVYSSGLSLRNFRIHPELRYWFNRPMARHFAGIAIEAGSFDLKFHPHHYTGSGVAAGVTYGYALVLSRHWNVEFSVGAGLARIWGFDYREPDTRPDNKNMNKWIPVPIGTGVTFSYIFK